MGSSWQICSFIKICLRDMIWYGMKWSNPLHLSSRSNTIKSSIHLLQGKITYTYAERRRPVLKIARERMEHRRFPKALTKKMSRSLATRMLKDRHTRKIPPRSGVHLLKKPQRENKTMKVNLFWFSSWIKFYKIFSTRNFCRMESTLTKNYF